MRGLASPHPNLGATASLCSSFCSPPQLQSICRLWIFLLWLCFRIVILVVRWVRIVILVALGPLSLPRWTSLRTTFTVFRFPRGARDGSDYDGTAHTGFTGSHVHFRADWTTCNSLSVFVESRVCSDGGVSEVMAVCGAVLCFVELHCDVLVVSPGDCGARSRAHGVLRHSSWVQRARRRQVTM